MAVYISNLLIFYDLAYRLRNPFKSAKVNLYIVIIVASIIWNIQVPLQKFLTNQTTEEQFKRGRYVGIYFAENVIMVSLTIIFFFDARIHLYKKGSSPDLKKKVFYQYLMYLIFYIPFTVNILIRDYGLQGQQNLISMAHHIDPSYEIIFDILASLLAFSRLLEPFILKSFFLDIKYYFPCFYKKVWNNKDSKLPLCMFSASAMNVEYVFLIITGITQLIDIN